MKSLHSMELSVFLKHLRYAVAIVDEAGQVLCANGIFESLFNPVGHTPRKNDFFEIFAGEQPVIDCFQKACRTRGTYYLKGQPFALGPGETKNMDVEVFPVVNERGELLGIAFMFLDLYGATHFQDHHKRLERLNTLSTIAVGLAHEIRNPLSGIKGASQLIRSEVDRPELKEYAEIIQSEVERVDKLVAELLTLAKPRTLTKEKINLNQLLHDVVLLQKTVEANKIQFVEEYDPSLPSLTADRGALSQVIINLTKNARQALPDGGRVTLRSRVVTNVVVKIGDKKKQLVGIDVEDNGPGIEPKTLENIFTPFFTTKSKGTGLGLALCQQLVEEHGGSLQVKSTLGKGTVFSVMLPID